MTDRVTFEVEGIPVAQGSMTAFQSASTGKIIMPQKAALLTWRTKVAEAGHKARSQAAGWPWDCAIAVKVDFYLPRPKSAKNRNYPHVKPDIDKLIRAVLDGLTGVLWVDDSRVVAVGACKKYAEGSLGSVQIEVMKV